MTTAAPTPPPAAAPAPAPTPAPAPAMTIKIDGREVAYEKGDTIIKAAYKAGIDIPHYCWHPGLSVAANCRMCLVEVLPPPGRPAMQLDILRWDAEKNEYIPQKKPKLLPSCQQECSPGMEVLSESSANVEEARGAVQELLLLNHPVDCPICDQAGECRLQDYWLEHQRKSKRMLQEPVHKPKGVVFGPTIVYDAERCIVCTRCVRVSAELAKDPVLSIRERGNLGEVVVSPGRELDHDYTLMTEHVCPVGALTSSDFRFKARVWFLRNARTICQGCATGCNAHLDYDPRNNTPYRHRPRDNEQVNKYWMCDEGMLSYKHAIEDRQTGALVGGEDASVADALVAATAQLKGLRDDPARVAIILSAQHSVEDNFALLTLARTYIGAVDFFVSGKPLGRGDAILMHQDKNPNTRGVVALCASVPEGAIAAPRPIADLLKGIQAGKYAFAIGLGADVEVEAKEAKSALSKLRGFVVIASHEGPLPHAAHVVLPACAWTETEGTYVNHKGLAQLSDKALKPLGDARPGWQLVADLGKALGYAISWKRVADLRAAMPADVRPPRPNAPGTTETTAAAAAVAAPIQANP